VAKEHASTLLYGNSKGGNQRSPLSLENQGIDKPGQALIVVYRRNGVFSLNNNRVLKERKKMMGEERKNEQLALGGR